MWTIPPVLDHVTRRMHNMGDRRGAEIFWFFCVHVANMTQIRKTSRTNMCPVFSYFCCKLHNNTQFVRLTFGKIIRTFATRWQI